MFSPPSRRTVLQLSGPTLVSVSGSLWGGLSDLAYSNRMGRDIVVTTTVTRVTTGETVLSDTKTIPTDDSVSYGNPIKREEPFLIRVSVENGPEETYEWTPSDSDAVGLSVRISGDAIEFTEVVR
ncbi:hypothetical protein [Halorarum salinum]|uniref:Uncharacterized protein n=1 Tax=Halorarum salinum TaxID=2743089 RepID=A0A7D5QGA6_9EURY|nr:hypothetical protein [Halobaculum salinum]QLG61324.1 hypothetical protein HUG12_06075 [Halobaculum salinum]